MNFLDLMKAKRKSGKTPTLARIEKTQEEQRRFESGLCIVCGLSAPAANSDICSNCEDTVSMADIRLEIQRMRNQILGSRSSGPSINGAPNSKIQ